jgi:hypothetical protein
LFFLTMPLMALVAISGIFYPINAMPGWLPPPTPSRAWDPAWNPPDPQAITGDPRCLARGYESSSCETAALTGISRTGAADQGRGGDRFALLLAGGNGLAPERLCGV